MKTTIRIAAALMGVMTLVSTATASRADGPSLQSTRDLLNRPVVSLPYPDLQPSTNPISNIGVADWVFINGQPNLRVWIRNNGNAVAPPSLARISFVNPSKTINIVATIPAISPHSIVARLVAAPFTNVGPGLALAIHADFNNTVQELNENNNDVYYYIPQFPIGIRN